MQDYSLPGIEADEFDPMPDIAVAKAFDKLLEELFRDKVPLRCIWVRPSARNFPIPGRFYIVRWHSNPELRTYWVVQNPDGSYCVPGEAHLEVLRRMDTTTRNVYSDVERARAKRQFERTRAVDEKRREFREKLTERLESLERTSVLFPGMKLKPIEGQGGNAIIAEVDAQNTKLFGPKGEVLSS